MIKSHWMNNIYRKINILINNINYIVISEKVVKC